MMSILDGRNQQSGSADTLTISLLGRISGRHAAFVPFFLHSEYLVGGRRTPSNVK